MTDFADLARSVIDDRRYIVLGTADASRTGRGASKVVGQVVQVRIGL
jgi:hypothetical protein